MMTHFEQIKTQDGSAPVTDAQSYKFYSDTPGGGSSMKLLDQKITRAFDNQMKNTLVNKNGHASQRRN